MFLQVLTSVLVKYYISQATDSLHSASQDFGVNGPSVSLLEMYFNVLSSSFTIDLIQASMVAGFRLVKKYSAFMLYSLLKVGVIVGYRLAKARSILY